MADPIDMIIPLLREMRAENAARHEVLEKRLGAIETALGTFRQALTADTLLSKLLTGEFEERIEALEHKVQELEKQK